MAGVPKEGNSNSTTSLEGVKKTTTTSLEGIKKRSSSLDRDPAVKKSHTPSPDAVKNDVKSGCTESTMV